MRRLLPALVAALAWSAPAQASCDPARPALDHATGRAPAGDRYVPCRYDTGARALEPSLGFTRDGRVLFQGWELRSGGPNGLPAAPVVRRSDASRERWEDVSPLGPVNSLDPYLEVDDRTGRIFSVNYTGDGQCSSVSSSDDEGASWRHSPIGACAGFDGQSLATGPPVSSTTIGYPDLVYYCTGATPASAQPGTSPVCSKSLDGGLVFAPTGGTPWPPVDDQAQDDVFGPWAGNPVVASDGVLHISKRHRGQPEVATSRDEGATWERVQAAANGSGGQTPRLALDAQNRLVMAYVGADHLPYLVTSVDRAKTWSAPLSLTPPGLREAALPWPAIAADGRVVVAYVGSTNSPAKAPYYAYCNSLLSPCEQGDYATTSWHGYMTLVHGAFSGRRQLLTATVNPPERPLFVGGCSADGACKAVLDFIDADFGPDGDAYAAFVDDCKITRDFMPAFGAELETCSDHVGEGIVGRLELQKAPASTRRCASRRRFLIRLDRRLVSARIRLSAGRASVIRGRRLRARIDLRGVARGTVVVRISGRTRSGRVVRSQRRYRTCAPRRAT
jgi:hypothetical protein